MSNRAWVTLATNDSYGLGALVLAHSLRRAGSAYPSVVLITPSVTEAMRERLRAVFAEVVTVDVLDSRDAAHLALLQRPELGITFTKIHCWNLTQYEKCVFLDADILVVQNCDELFEREELSAAPDVGWPDCFNSGVFVFTPSTETFNQLIAFARERGSFDGGDQGLLNSFFSDWARGDINKHLPFLYNVTSAAFYSYLPALKHYGQNLKVIHFIGAAKPWLQHFNWDSSTVDAPEHLREFLQLWWDLFVAQVHSQLDTSMVEVEEVPPVPPPEQPPHDVSPHYHYQPVLDPESEFPWHHPGAQIPEENLEERIDFTDINDPWEIYRGHIPPRSENASTCHSVFERNEDQEEIRLYAWAYQSQNNNNKSNEHNVGHYEQLAHSASYNDNYQHNNDNERNYQEYIETQRYKQNHDPQILQDRYEPQTYHFSHEPQSYQQHYEEHRHPPHSERSQHFQHEYEHQSNQEYCLYEQSIDDNPWHRQHYETQHNSKDLNVQNFQKDFEYIPSNIDSFQNDYNTTYDSIYIEHNNIHQHHDTHEHSRHQHYNVENYPEKQYEYFDHSKQHYTHNYDQLSHQKESFCVTEKIQNNEHCDTISENQSVSHSKSKNIEVFNLQVQQKKKRTHADRIHRIDFGMSPPKMNGDISDTDSDASEEIIPRHPYDGFYLRHRAIIDAYGRKICTHEIPPVPPQSLSPPPQQVLELVNPEGDQNLSSSGSENQSGVAGNFARVVPGSVSQGEALDELTRRQGWEAGNIDYMGADSFANIWAKISQTLSQPRTSPAKSPPRESTPSKSAPMEDKPAEVILETTTEPVEIAKEATEATTLAEVPAQTEVVAPLETPAVSATGVEAAAKIEGTVPVDAATPGKAAVPVQAVVPVKTAASVEPAAPVEIATLVGTTATAETVAPVENAAPVETSMPDVAPVKVDAPIEVATLVEAVAQIEAPKPTAEAPVTDPVKESTEKVTPDIPLTVEAAAPSVREIVETSAEITTPPEVPVTVEASEKIQVIPTTEAPVQIPVEALQKTECIVPVASAPVAAKAPQAPSDIPVPVETAAEIPVPVETAPEAKKTESAETPAVQSEAVIVSELVAKALKPSDAVEACPASPAVAAEAPEPPLEATPPKVQAAPASDSPPLAHTPSKEEAPAVPAAKSEERRKPVGKLQLSPPAAPDPLPTPDSEAEDAAALAHSIIASELQAAATPTPPTPVDRLTVEEPEVPTPPVGAVSLAQIGVKPVKGKPTIAAQIESSVTEKDDSAATPPAPVQAATAETPKEAAKVAPKDAPKEAPKKKVVKKVVKKESGASGAGGDAPVPPPRKKEKKPKEK